MVVSGGCATVVKGDGGGRRMVEKMVALAEPDRLLLCRRGQSHKHLRIWAFLGDKTRQGPLQCYYSTIPPTERKNTESLPNGKHH